jgi:hypothetical protein
MLWQQTTLIQKAIPQRAATATLLWLALVPHPSMADGNGTVATYNNIDETRLAMRPIGSSIQGNVVERFHTSVLNLCAQTWGLKSFAAKFYVTWHNYDYYYPDQRVDTERNINTAATFFSEGDKCSTGAPCTGVLVIDNRASDMPRSRVNLNDTSSCKRFTHHFASIFECMHTANWSGYGGKSQAINRLIAAAPDGKLVFVDERSAINKGLGLNARFQRSEKELMTAIPSVSTRIRIESPKFGLDAAIKGCQ